MTLRDWEIFFRYSSRVRHLFKCVGSEFLTCSNLGDDVIFALSNPPTYGPLIPYLRTLHWDKPDRELDVFMADDGKDAPVDSESKVVVAPQDVEMA